MSAISGACHCGAVRWTYPRRPDWLNQCNCSYCRRAGGLWAYADVQEISIDAAPDAAIRYSHGDRMLAFVSCATCGCTTHWESLNPEEHPRMAVNFAMADPADYAGVRIRHFDGADSWTYLD